MLNFCLRLGYRYADEGDKHIYLLIFNLVCYLFPEPNNYGAVNYFIVVLLSYLLILLSAINLSDPLSYYR